MMFGCRRKEPKVEEPNFSRPIDERTIAEIRAEDEEYRARVKKRQLEIDVKERAKVRQEMMVIWTPWKAAFHTRARQARADRHCRLPYRM